MVQHELDFRDAAHTLVNGPFIGSNHRRRMAALIRYFHSRGATIEQLCDKRYLNRSERVLEAYARRLGLVFPDYVPKALQHRAGHA
jgi:hypothetical protein